MKEKSEFDLIRWFLVGKKEGKSQQVIQKNTENLERADGLTKCKLGRPGDMAMKSGKSAVLVESGWGIVEGG